MERSYLRRFLRCIVLNVLGMLGLSCYILADTYFIAQWLGSTGLAALNLSIPVYNLINGCGLMLGMGGATQYNYRAAEGGQRAADAVVTRTFCMGAVLAAGFMLLGAFCSGGLAQLLGADVQTFAMSRTYLRMLLLCAPLFLGNSMLLCFLRNDGVPGLAMAAMVTGSLSNIFLDYLFIFRLGMGMFGAVFATCLAPMISLCVQSVHFLRRRNGFRFVRCRMQLRQCAEILVSGGSSLVTEVSSGLVIIVFNLLMLRIAGNTGVAAYGVVANLSLVVTAVYTGIAQGAQPMMSQEFACANAAGVRSLRRYALLGCAGLSVLLYAGMLLFAQPITTLFNSEGDPQLQRLAAEGLQLYFLGALPAGCNILLSVYFPCIARPGAGNWISLLRGVLLIVPLAFLMAQLWGSRGIWLTYPAAELLTAGVCIFFLRHCKSRKEKSA